MRSPVAALCFLLLTCLCCGAGEPATQPSQAAKERAAALRRDIQTFSLGLFYTGPQDKPFYNLHLLMQMPDAKFRQAPNDLYVQISEAQANKVIDFLLADGALYRAHTPEPGGAPLPGPCYGWSINGEFSEDLGWKLPMFVHLDGLRKVLDGEAATKMDVLLERLQHIRYVWIDEENAAKALAGIPTARASIAAHLAEQTGETGYDASIRAIVKAWDAKYDSLKEKDRATIMTYSQAYSRIDEGLRDLRIVTPLVHARGTQSVESQHVAGVQMICWAAHPTVDDAAVGFYRQVTAEKWFIESKGIYSDEVLAIIKDCDARHVTPPFAVLMKLWFEYNNNKNWPGDLMTGNACYDAGMYEHALGYYKGVPEIGMGQFRIVDTYLAMGKYDDAKAALEQIDQNLDRWVAETGHAQLINLAVPLLGQTRDSLTKLIAEKRALIAAKGPKPARPEFQGY